MDKNELKLYASRMEVSKKLGYCSQAMHAMPVHFKEDAPEVSADDKWRLYVNPEYLEEHPKEYVAARMANQMLKCVLSHAKVTKGLERMLGSDFKLDRAQKASDLSVNDILQDAHMTTQGLDVPEQHGFPKGKSMLEYYNMLKDEDGDEDDPVNSDNPDSGADSGGQGEGEGQGEGDSEGEGPSSGTFGGSSADAKPRDYEEAQGEGDPVEADDAEAIKMATAQAIKFGGDSRGRMPAGLERFADELIEPPKVPWEAELATIVSTSCDKMMGHDDYAYNRPHKKTLNDPDYEDMIIPVPYRPSINPVVLIDTSGSMYQEELTAGLVETKGVLQAIGAPLRLISCDTEITDHGEMDSVEGVKLVGGGGTDMSDGMRWIDENVEQQPDVMIVITDCYTPWPDQQPEYEVIVLNTRKNSGHSVPDWVKKIDIEIV